MEKPAKKMQDTANIPMVLTSYKSGPNPTKYI